ncbi:MAG: methylmalonyl-CoA mutase family protein, partial [Bacteroidaceae bacterium]
MMAVKENLFADFPPVSTQDWIDKITVDLKGADFEKRLVWKTTEGFKMKPFYRKEDVDGLATMNALPGEFPYLRGTKKANNAWFVRQDIAVETPEGANAKALELLNKGIDSLGFTIKSDQLSADFITILLNGICADCVELNFTTCQRHSLQLAQLLASYFQEKEYKPAKIKGSINFDPYEVILKKGIE